jgi:hypothetical protein
MVERKSVRAACEHVFACLLGLIFWSVNSNTLHPDSVGSGSDGRLDMMAAARQEGPRHGVPGQSEGQVVPVRSPGAEQAGEGGGSADDLEQAITVLRARVDEEFRIAERLDSKQRQAFALASVFFAVVQTVAFGSFAQSNLHTTQRAIIGGLAVVAGLVLITVMNRLNNAEELHPEDDVRPEAVVDWCNEADSPGYVAARLVGELSDVARRRSSSNEARAHNYDMVATATRWSLIVTGVELLIAIALRI